MSKWFRAVFEVRTIPSKPWKPLTVWTRDPTTLPKLLKTFPGEHRPEYKLYDRDGNEITSELVGDRGVDSFGA